jgi:methyl-accepting chemotaxis protein
MAINEMISTISAIAAQINLLALRARVCFRRN